MTRNGEVARRLEEYADLLEADGDDYRPRSYRRAAENIREHPEAIEDLAAAGPDAVREIEGVGESIAAKVVELVETGTFGSLEDAREELPIDVGALTGVEGIGPKTAGDLYRELGITDLDELEAAAREGRIREVEGYGERTEQNILENVAFARRAGERELLGDARPLGEDVRSHLADGAAVERCALAGSLRRWRATIGDVDVLAAGEDGGEIVDRLLDWEAVTEEIESGATKASVRVRGVRVDLRVVDPAEWGSALQYFTGSKDHNIRLRNRAIDRGLKVNEYGVFDVPARGADGTSDGDAPDAGERVAGETEAGVYGALGLEPMAPELREDRGEIDAAARGDLPDLIGEGDVRGDLHVHTDWSDGGATIEEMIEAAAAFGHEYVCITDHASGPGVVGGMGLPDDEIREQAAAIREAGEDAGIDVLAGIEANVGADCEVSVGDGVVDDLDLVVASPHSGLGGDGTDRIVAAIEHPGVDVIGHPTGRLLNDRPGLDIDVEAVAAAAADEGVALEINANPRRLDLRGGAVRRAVEAGAPIAINTDAHRPAEYGNLGYGVHTARRGWAEPGDVINARDADGLRSFLG